VQKSPNNLKSQLKTARHDGAQPANGRQQGRADDAGATAAKTRSITARAAALADRLTLAVEPLAASTTLVNLRLRYAVTLTNMTDGDIEITGAAATLFTGAGAQEAVLRQWFDAAALASQSDAIVPAKGALRLENDVVVPLRDVHAMEARGKIVILPVLVLAFAYRHATGVGKLARAFVVGGADGTAERGGKLAPLLLDQGMRGFGPLAARDSGIAASS
jgi:hypothetical protein